MIGPQAFVAGLPGLLGLVVAIGVAHRHGQSSSRLGRGVMFGLAFVGVFMLDVAHLMAVNGDAWGWPLWGLGLAVPTVLAAVMLARWRRTVPA